MKDYFELAYFSQIGHTKKYPFMSVRLKNLLACCSDIGILGYWVTQSSSSTLLTMCTLQCFFRASIS